MGEILIVIAILVIRALIKKNGEAGRLQQNQRQQRSWQVQQAPVQQMQQASAAMSQKQRELKERLLKQYGNVAKSPVQQYGSGVKSPAQQYGNTAKSPAQQYRNTAKSPAQQKNAYPRQTAASGDILSRAAENVRANDVDVLEQQDFLAKVETLMITGYQAKLTYERDFLSEGMDMLNSYRLPDAVPELMKLEM